MESNLDENGMCKICHYHWFIHNMKDLPPRCEVCPKPMPERMEGHGIYDNGGFQLPPEMEK